MAVRRKTKGTLSLSSRLNLAFYRAIFRALAWSRPPRPVPIVLRRESRVLVFSTAGLGDSLFDSAGIRALSEAHPGIRVEAVVHHRRTDIARHNPLIAQLHLLRKGPHAFVLLWLRLRKVGSWDAVLFLSCHDPEARCLGYLLAPDATVGLAWRTGMPWLCARNVDEPALRRAHLAAQAVRVAVEAGAKPSAEVRMVYEVTASDRMALDDSLKALALPGTPTLVFQLGGGGGPFRDWPASHFAELARLASAAGIGPIFLLGGPDHRKKAEKVVASLPAGVAVCDVVGRLPLPQSAALLERCRCLVSTDTGMMHLAFALRVPTVALLHCTPGEARVGPTTDRDKHIVIQLPKPEGYQKPSDASMEGITPQEVLEAVERILTRTL